MPLPASLMGKTKEWFWVAYENAPGHMVSGDLLAAVRADMDRQDPPGILRRCPRDDPGVPRS